MGDKQSKEEEEMAVVCREDEDDEEDGYFSGYAHFSIHHDMLAVNQISFDLKLIMTISNIQIELKSGQAKNGQLSRCNH